MATQAGLMAASEISAFATMYAQRRSGDIPHPDKGALWATQPGDPTKGDILKFRFYPSTLPIELSRNVAAETIAGRAMPAFQDLGGGGAKFTVELLFSDAWLTYSGNTPLRTGTPLETTARHAKTWFDMYIAGHDGGGISIPLVYTYFQLGHSNPVRVIIHSAKLITEFFDKNDNPMQINATVEMSVFEPVEFVSPFKPKAKPKSTGSSKPKPETNQCPEPVCPVCVCPGSDNQDKSTESAEARTRVPAGPIGAMGADYDQVIRQSVAHARANQESKRAYEQAGVSMPGEHNGPVVSAAARDAAFAKQQGRTPIAVAAAEAAIKANRQPSVYAQVQAANAEATARVAATASASKRAKDARDYQRYQESLSRMNSRR